MVLKYGDPERFKHLTALLRRVIDENMIRHMIHTGQE